jgi:hypothetical protein
MLTTSPDSHVVSDLVLSEVGRLPLAEVLAPDETMHRTGIHLQWCADPTVRS